MIHKKYIDELRDDPVDIELICPETIEENEAFNREIERIRLLLYFLGGLK